MVFLGACEIMEMGRDESELQYCTCMKYHVSARRWMGAYSQMRPLFDVLYSDDGRTAKCFQCITILYEILHFRNMENSNMWELVSILIAVTLRAIKYR